MSNLAPQDTIVDRLRNARGRTVVGRIQILTFLSGSPDTHVFVFEGNDDKVVYSQWIERACPGVIYEPFPCSSKNQVLSLKNSFDSELNGLGGKVSFFIDRDFDEDVEDNLDNLFITDRHSVENYLIGENLINFILKEFFHCHGDVETRGRLCAEFMRILLDFLNKMAPVNERIFLSARCKVAVVPGIPDKLSEFVDINLDSISELKKSPHELIVLEKEISDETALLHREYFSDLCKFKRHRGKFSYEFFKKWIDLLADHHATSSSSYFPNKKPGDRARRHEITMGALASKSEMPIGLADFVRRRIPELGECLAAAS